MAPAVSHCSGSICNHSLKKKKNKNWNSGKLSVESKKQTTSLLTLVIPGTMKNSRFWSVDYLEATGWYISCLITWRGTPYHPHTHTRYLSGEEYYWHNYSLIAYSLECKKQAVVPGSEPYSSGPVLTILSRSLNLQENL